MKPTLMIFALLLAANTADGAPVDVTQASGFASQVAVDLDGGGSGGPLNLVVLAADGRVWEIWRQPSGSDFEFGWQAPAGSGGSFPNSVPVPVSEITDWTPMSIVLKSGVVMVWSNVALEWQTVGEPWQIAPLPGFAPVASESSAMGSVKSMFR